MANIKHKHFVTIILNLNFYVKECLYLSPKFVFLFIFIYPSGNLGKLPVCLNSYMFKRLSFVAKTKNQEQCSLLTLSEAIKVYEATSPSY